MVEIKCPNGLGHKDRKHDSFYMNPGLKESLDIEMQAMKDSEQDLVLVMDGLEGSGKSKFSRQIAYYCSTVLGTNFDQDGTGNIFNDVDDYIKHSLKAGPFAINILDESRNALLKLRSMAQPAVKFTNFMSECRSLRQVHIILLPAYHDLDKYIVMWRMNFLVHLLKKMVKNDKSPSGYKLDLGGFKVFPNDRYTKMWYVTPGFRYPKGYAIMDRFPNFEVLSEKGLRAYEKQKELKMAQKYGPDGKIRIGARDDGMKRMKFFIKAMGEAKCKHCGKLLDFKHHELGRLLDLKRQTISNFIQNNMEK